MKIYVIRKTKEIESPGYISAPYILGEHTEESRKKYDKFMKKYHKNHKYCPRCGFIKHTTTLVGYPLIDGKENEYKDLNRCECLSCGDIHTCHERVKNRT